MHGKHKSMLIDRQGFWLGPFGLFGGRRPVRVSGHGPLLWELPLVRGKPRSALIDQPVLDLLLDEQAAGVGDDVVHELT